MIRQILFITSSRIGDAVISNSILNYIISKYNNAEVTIACSSLVAPMFADFPQLKKIILHNSSHGGLHWIKTWVQVVTNRWDIVIDIRGSAIAWLLNTKKRMVWRKPRQANLVHRIQQIAAMLSANALRIENVKPKIWLSNARISKIKQIITSSIIAIAPVSNYFEKNWPEEKFAELMTKIAQLPKYKNYKFVILCNVQERANLSILNHTLPQKCIDIKKYDHILDVAAIINQCDFFIGNDSGLMHIAAALNIVTLGLFGPSNHHLYRPLGKNGYYIKAADGNLKHLSVEQVYNQLVNNILKDGNNV